MAAVGDDCYFFCTATCAKGPACPFRHVEAAKTCKIICQHWQTVGCFRPMCKFRHSDFHIQINYSEIPCYWESQPSGCNKANCLYKHTKPRPENAITGDPSLPPEKESIPLSTESDQQAGKFVMPTVKPIIIDPDSEASNSSPVKHSASKEIRQDISIKKKLLNVNVLKPPEVDKKVSDDHPPTKNEQEDEAVKVVKKKPILKQKNGKAKLATVKKLKKKEAINSTKSAVKRKSSELENKVKPAVPVKKPAGKKSAVVKKSAPPITKMAAPLKKPASVKKNVKERLGLNPAVTVAEEESEEDDSSDSDDSDDSIENVKVLSMEEIFRQKALESMMKTRAAQGKPLLPEYNRPKQIPKQLKSVGNKIHTEVKVVQRPLPLLKSQHKKQRPLPLLKSQHKKQSEVKEDNVDGEEEEDDDDEEEEDDDEEEERAAKEESEDDEYENVSEEEEEEQKVTEEDENNQPSSIESESSSEVSSESEEETERRVVIDLEAEKAARDKAKASLLKKRVGQSRAPIAASKIKKRKVISEKLSVKDRLGKPRPLSAVSSSVSAVSSVKGIDSRLVSSKMEKKMSSEEDDESDGSDEGLPDVKIKSLGEILQRKKPHDIKGSSPVKERLGVPVDFPGKETKEKPSRKILLTENESPKKAKKRSWLSGSTKTKLRMSADDDQRQVSTSTDNQRLVSASPDDERQVSRIPPFRNDSSGKLEQDEPESPFEAMRRRALLKKTQLLEEKNLSETKDMEAEFISDEERKIVKGKKKKHKHKHRKKSKKERQIYVPPAKKSSVTVEETHIPRSLTIETELDEDLPDFEEASVKVECPTRPKHKAGAMWLAGLSVPAKGLGGRPHLRAAAGSERDNILQSSSPPRPLKSLATASKACSRPPVRHASSAGTEIPVVKTFSQIMAEKRQKRFQTQDNTNDTMPSNSSSLEPLRISRVPKTEEAKPKAPITPIIFGKSDHKKELTSRSRPVSSVNSSVHPSKPTVLTLTDIDAPLPPHRYASSPPKTQLPTSMSDVRPSYKTARAKKLFKKSKPPTTQDTSVHISNASGDTSSDLMQKPDDSTISSSISTEPQRRTSTTSESQSKSSVLVEDEFSFFDGGDMDDISFVEGGNDVEPIDDLLQDIDELLA